MANPEVQRELPPACQSLIGHFQRALDAALQIHCGESGEGSAQWRGGGSREQKAGERRGSEVCVRIRMWSALK